jgi:hypothetical protein
VVMGGSGGVLEHEGEERKVRGHGHLVRRALEAELTERGGGDGSDGYNLGASSGTPAAGLDL